MDEIVPAISRKAIPQKFQLVNFKEDKFSFLNITALVKRIVDKAGKFTCEILSSDKYNNSEGFLPSKNFHHFSIVVRNLSL